MVVAPSSDVLQPLPLLAVLLVVMNVMAEREWRHSLFEHLLEAASILDPRWNQKEEYDGQVAQSVPPVVGDQVLHKLVRYLVNLMRHADKDEGGDNDVQHWIARHED